MLYDEKKVPLNFINQVRHSNQLSKKKTTHFLA